MVDVRRPVESAIRMASHEIRQRARLVPELAAVPRVRASGAHLGQVFLNLLVNAAQAIPIGQPDLHTIQLRLRSDGLTVVVEVEDSGVGIAPAELERIFEPFFTTKPEGGGTGLGLSICRDTVQAAGGTLEVESELGRGSLVRVTLPVAAEAAESTPAASGSEALPPGRRLSVLIVDDEAQIRAALEDLLQELHDVSTAAGGGEVLERLAGGERYDVILCDLMMPDLSGMDVHERLLTTHPDQAARMLFLSGGPSAPRAAASSGAWGIGACTSPRTSTCS